VADPRTVILLSLTKSTHLLKVIFSKEEMKAFKPRIDQIVNGEAIGKAAKETIDAMQVVVLMTCIMPALTAATITSN
jgi:hypothetical protein